MGFLRFLSSLRTLAKNGDITIRDAYKFAQQEFGEVSDLLKLQINKIFKDADAPSIRKPENKNNVFTFVPKDKLRPAQMEEATGIESLKNPYRIGGGLDPVEGMTRTAARVVLDRKGIKVPEKGDPIDVFEENFGGDALMDLKEAGEELLEKETTGRITESMGEFLESKGLFDLKVDKTLPKGMTNEELLKKLMDEDPEEFAKGGRVGYEDGGPTKDEYGIMSLPSVPSNPNSVNDDIDRVAQLVAQSYKMGPEEQMNNKQIAYDRIEEIAEQISYGGNIDGVRSNLIDYFNNKVQEYENMIQEFSTGGRVGFQIGGPAYDATNPIYGSSAITVTPDTIMGPQGNQIQAQTGVNPLLQRIQKANPAGTGNFLKGIKDFGQHAMLSEAMAGNTGMDVIPQYGMQSGYDFQKKFQGLNPMISSGLAAAYQTLQEGSRALNPFGDTFLRFPTAMKTAQQQATQNIEGILAAESNNLTPQQQADRNKYLAALGQPIEQSTTAQLTVSPQTSAKFMLYSDPPGTPGRTAIGMVDPNDTKHYGGYDAQGRERFHNPASDEYDPFSNFQKGSYGDPNYQKPTMADVAGAAKTDPRAGIQEAFLNELLTTGPNQGQLLTSVMPDFDRYGTYTGDDQLLKDYAAAGRGTPTSQLVKLPANHPYAGSGPGYYEYNGTDFSKTADLNMTPEYEKMIRLNYGLASGGRVGYAYGSGLKLIQILQKAGKSLKQAIKEAVDNINPTGDKKLDADMAVDDMLETYSIDRDAVDGYDILNAYDEAYKTIANPKTMSEVETLEAMGANITAKTLELVEKYPGLNSELARKIASDPDPQRQAEVISTIEQAFELMKKGKSSDEVLDIMKQMTDRTKQAGGGLSYLSGF